MKIVICGSMKFARQMDKVRKQLEGRGYVVFVPEFVDDFINGKLGWRLGTLSEKEGAEKKKQHDLIRKHYQKIKRADAILVLNYTKKGIKNYIGGNSFLEMGFAYILKKKIYLLNPLPKVSFYYEEVLAMEPIVLNGDLFKIK